MSNNNQTNTHKKESATETKTATTIKQRGGKPKKTQKTEGSLNNERLWISFLFVVFGKLFRPPGPKTPFYLIYWESPKAKYGALSVFIRSSCLLSLSEPHSPNFCKMVCTIRFWALTTWHYVSRGSGDLCQFLTISFVCDHKVYPLLAWPRTSKILVDKPFFARNAVQHYLPWTFSIGFNCSDDLWDSDTEEVPNRNTTKKCKCCFQTLFLASSPNST